MSEDLFCELADFGSPYEDDTSAKHAARAARIEAARRAGKQYEAKVEEPGWFNDPVLVARSKGPARPALFALHELYYRQQFREVVEGGFRLLEKGPGKEESEVRDVVLRAAVRCGVGKGEGWERREEVRGLAARWREYPNLPALSFTSARILFSNSALSPSPSTSNPVPVSEVLEASLSSLRLHPSQHSYHPLLSLILRPSHPLLSEVIDEGKKFPMDERREEVESEVKKVEVSGKGREILRRVLGLDGQAKEEEEEMEGVGRDVRSL
ncbi:hypothetical protein JCM8547_003685 [Rhodosporidiobolus lusitaniae]